MVPLIWPIVSQQLAHDNTPGNGPKDDTSYQIDWSSKSMQNNS